MNEKELETLEKAIKSLESAGRVVPLLREKSTRAENSRIARISVQRALVTLLWHVTNSRCAEEPRERGWKPDL